jgi:chloramphenicol-sensitive protein RarD
MSERRRGAFLGIAAYTMWGLFPLYWPLLRPAGAFEILAHRVVWSAAFMAVLMARTRSLDWLRSLGGRRIGLLAIAAALISINWVVYIWGVTHGHVVETSLGYFISPLVTVVMGVAFLRERPSRGEWIGIGIAAVAVIVLAFEYGRMPWIALGLAGSFGVYGFVKKRAGVAALPSLTIETGLLFVPALAYLVFLEATGSAMFTHVSTGKDLLLAAGGVITAVPLLCFAAAANRIPLTMLGILQYLAPGLQFLCGVVVYGEAMPPSRWIGFALVWAGLAVFTVASMVNYHRSPRRAVATA